MSRLGLWPLSLWQLAMEIMIIGIIVPIQNLIDSHPGLRDERACSPLQTRKCEGYVIRSTSLSSLLGLPVRSPFLGSCAEQQLAFPDASSTEGTRIWSRQSLL